MKCSQCGAELNGEKFCTNCGTPVPQETTGAVCSNCGEPVDGKFCTKCGTPVEAPLTNAVNETAGAATDTASDAAPQPVDFQNPYVEDTQPVQYNADTTQNAGKPTNNGYTGQQFTNQPNGTYTGQQFTNKPNTAPNGKKPMSGGKIAIIVVSIVVGLIIILGIIIGVVACNIVKGVNSAINTYGDNFSSAVDEFSNYIDDYSSDLDSYFDDYSSDLDSYLDDYSTATVTDPETGVVFEESDRYDGWAVVDYEKSDYNSSTITVDIPEQFQGRDVVEIKRLYVYDNDSTDKGYIKIIIPGTVKVIDSYSISFLEDINEVVIEDGVETIEEDAFAGDKDLLKVHIPASVTEIDDECGIGYYTDTEHDYEDIPFGKEFTLYCEKGSAAESYAKEHKLNYETK